MPFTVRHGGAAIPLIGQAAYSYGQYQRRERRASRALQRRMQEKSLEARESSQIRAIEAQQDRDVEMTTRRTRELEQQARLGREAAEQQFDLREDFAERKMEMNQDQMEFALEQKKDIYDFELTESDKRRKGEIKREHDKVNDMLTAGTITAEEADQFHQQLDLKEAGIQPSKRKKWPEGKSVGQMWEYGNVGSGLVVTRKPDGTVTKLFDTRQQEQTQVKEKAKLVSDRRKALDKIQAEKRKYIADREKETIEGAAGKVARYSPGEIRRRAGAIFNDRIFEAQTNLVDARLGTEGEAPGGGLRPAISTAEELGMTGEAPPASAVLPSVEQAAAGISPITGGGVGEFASAEAAFGGAPGGQAAIAQVPAMLQRYEALARQGKLSPQEQAVYERLKALAARGIGAR